MIARKNLGNPRSLVGDTINDLGIIYDQIFYPK